MVKSKGRFDLRKMVITAVLGAISVVFGMTPLGFIPIGPTRATIMHIPVIIGAVMEGPIVGGLIGLIFGLFSIYQAIVSPTVVSFVFRNPIVAILPRVLIGVVSYYIYSGLGKMGKKNTRTVLYIIWLGILAYLSYGIYVNVGNSSNFWLKAMNSGLIILTSIMFYYMTKKAKALDIVLAATIGTLTNTIGVLSLIYFIYAEKFVAALGADVSTARKVIFGIGVANGIPEAIIAVIIVTSVVGALKNRNM